MKKTLLVLLLAALLILLCSCGNRSLFDTTYTFTRAIIALPNGTYVDGPVTSWRDQVTITGVPYLTHASNVVLMAG